MTRISSYDLYKCESCSQIHVKPKYGSVSTYRPKDLHIEPTDLKKCKYCGRIAEFQTYHYVRSSKKIDTKPPSMVGHLIRWLHKDPYIELDVRRLYPRFD
jgi:hypothetical protein